MTHDDSPATLIVISFFDATLCREFGLDENKRLMLYISSFGYASMDEKEVAELSQMAGEDFTGFAKTNRESMAAT